MGVSSAVAIQELLEGRAPAKKPGGSALLSGLGARLTRASNLLSPSHRDPLPTSVPGLDRLLAGGLPRGGLVELASARSSGRFSVAIAALAATTSSGESAALVDLGGHLDPQAAVAAGVELTRLLWVRPHRVKEAVASAEMLLATGFSLVVVDLGLAPVRGRFVPDAAWLRLGRTARSRGAALLLSTPYRLAGHAADAVVAMESSSALWCGTGGAPRLLEGLSSRLTLQKYARARSGLSEAVMLSVWEVPHVVIPSAARQPGLLRHLPGKVRDTSSLRSSG